MADFILELRRITRITANNKVQAHPIDLPKQRDAMAAYQQQQAAKVKAVGAGISRGRNKKTVRSL